MATGFVWLGGGTQPYKRTLYRLVPVHGTMGYWNSVGMVLLKMPRQSRRIFGTFSSRAILRATRAWRCALLSSDYSRLPFRLRKHAASHYYSPFINGASKTQPMNLLPGAFEAYIRISIKTTLLSKTRLPECEALSYT